MTWRSWSFYYHYLRHIKCILNRVWPFIPYPYSPIQLRIYGERFTECNPPLYELEKNSYIIKCIINYIVLDEISPMILNYMVTMRATIYIFFYLIFTNWFCGIANVYYDNNNCYIMLYCKSSERRGT